MFYAVASAVLANEVDVVIRIAILIINNRDSGGQRYHLHHNLQIAKHKRRELEEEELLEQEREEMLEQVAQVKLFQLFQNISLFTMSDSVGSFSEEMICLP